MKLNKKALKSITSLIDSLSYDLETGKLTTSEVKEKLNQQETQAFLETFIKQIKNDIFSKQMIRHFGLPLWGLSMSAPAMLMGFNIIKQQPYGKAFFNLIKQSMSFQGNSMENIGNVFKVVITTTIVQRMTAAWKAPFLMELGKSVSKEVKVLRDYKELLSQAEQAKEDLDELLDLIQKREEKTYTVNFTLN